MSYRGMSLKISMTLMSDSEQHVWRIADVRCGLDRGPLCRTNRPYAGAAIASAAFARVCSTGISATQRFSPNWRFMRNAAKINRSRIESWTDMR
jgi:hypothetical protein